MKRRKKNTEEQEQEQPAGGTPERSKAVGKKPEGGKAADGKPSGRKRMEAFLTAGIMAVTVLVIVLVVWFQRSVDSITINGGVYNYFGERRIEYPGTCRLQYKDGTVTLKDENGTHQLDSTPLYSANGNITIPYDYVWNDISSGMIYRLGHFGTIRNEDSMIKLTDGDRKKENARGFLYDGVDTYLFLEHVTVTAGEETFQLPAMSYAVARYGNTLQYYVGGTDKSVVVRTGEGDQLAVFGNGDTLNLGTDTLYLANGTWQLLVVRPQVLDRMN